MTGRLTILLLALALALTAGASTAAADDAWHSEQPPTAGSDVPVPLGEVYDIKFWAPNRGVLITADGLWAYDGTGWHRLSTVCGGQNGRIAWAGPLDFWTISTQPAGQANPGHINTAARSLCHFVNGAVVASYAQPLGLATSYLPMNAAVCLAPDDCWFAGERLSGTMNVGAFHLHWDGTTLTPWPSLTDPDPSLVDPDRAIADMAVHQGEVYESVRVDGNQAVGENGDDPFLLHRITAGTPPAFTPMFPTESLDYRPSSPSALDGFRLSDDGNVLWALAGPRNPASVPAPLKLLRLGPDGLAPVHLDPSQTVFASDVLVNQFASEPGTDSVWISYMSAGESTNGTLARLVRVHRDGTVDAPIALPDGSENIARKYQAGQIACPAQGQCWMATRIGWLFHLGGSLPRDDAPEMHRLITYRPSDASTVVFSPDTLPDDNSGIAPPVINQPPPLPYTPPTNTGKKAKAKKLVTNLKKPKLRGLILELKFTLTAKAHVQLVAKRKKSVVARTKRRTLAKGTHTLRLKLSRKRWPTGLDLRVAAIGTSKSTDEPQAGDGVDSEEADDNLSGGTVTISSVRKAAK